MSVFLDSEVKRILCGDRIVVVGGGIGGLVAAIDLARQGCRVTVLERAAAPGGKMRQVVVAGRTLDAGPTVFTMRWVFDAIFADAGACFEDHVQLQPAAILARHAWSETERLDLHADLDASAEAIGAFAGPADRRGFLQFADAARRAYDALERPFIQAKLPTMLSLATEIGSLSGLLAIKPFRTLWTELSAHMRDPRLRQLFGRYATYCGSSPFRAPATLMLVAHVERQGVWFVGGGMHSLAVALARLAQARGVVFRYSAEVAAIATDEGRASGVRLASGETLPAASVVFNGDPQALAAGLLGRAAAVGTVQPRSLSALTWTGIAHADGFPLLRHTVFFSRDYAAEFADLGAACLPREPTVYVCAQDRDDTGRAPGEAERLLLLVNAPATGDIHDFTPAEIDRCKDQMHARLRGCGLRLTGAELAPTSPSMFDRLFPGTGGALYGPAVHGATASFRRPGSRTALPGLYLAGGGTHPGAGVPMAALSGRLAASAVMADLPSRPRSRPAAMPGGMSMR